MKAAHYDLRGFTVISPPDQGGNGRACTECAVKLCRGSKGRRDWPVICRRVLRSHPAGRVEQQLVSLKIAPLTSLGIGGQPEMNQVSRIGSQHRRFEVVLA